MPNKTYSYEVDSTMDRVKDLKMKLDKRKLQIKPITGHIAQENDSPKTLKDLRSKKREKDLGNSQKKETGKGLSPKK